MRKTIKFAILALIFGFLSFMIISFINFDFSYEIEIINGLDESRIVQLWPNRLKAVLISAFAGGALAIAGLLLQKVTRNNLAEVSIVGIGSINIMFIVVYVLVFGKEAFGNGFAAAFLPIVTLLASFLGTGIVWYFSRGSNGKNNKFIIVGIALQFLFEGLSVMLVNPSKVTNDTEKAQMLSTIKDYTIGMITPNDDKWWLIITCCVIITVAFFVIMLLRNKLDVIEVSDELPTSLGINVERMKTIIYFLVALIAAAEAVMAGTIALLGILAPAIAKKMFPNKTIYIAPASFLIGAILVMGASYISLTLETQIPIGILSTTIVIPYFIYMIIKEK